MNKHKAEPNAGKLIESLRSIGYSFEAAVADLVDNSISAQSNRIEVRCDYNSMNPYLYVLDDGRGMDKKELFHAMKFGSSGPNEVRSPDDLGRFGLGMKTASLSQCSILTVVSKKEGEINALRWDVETVLGDGEWNIIQLDENSIAELPGHSQLTGYTTGTLVIWQNMDRVEKRSSDIAITLSKKMTVTRRHLSRTYHRYIDGDARKVQIKVNNAPIEANDPFLTNNVKTQCRPERKIQYGNDQVIVQAYILPHLNEISNEEIESLGGRGELRRLQGFYVYRCKRLIIPGTWFGVASKKELSNLARIRIDLPNNMDIEWDVDVKKMVANLPDALKEKISQNIEDVTDRSRNVYSKRGRKQKDQEQFVWIRLASHEGEQTTYSANRDNPLIKRLMENGATPKEVQALISILEGSLPYSAIIADVENNLQPTEMKVEELISVAEEMLRAGAITIEKLKTVEPFYSYPEIYEKFAERR